MTERSCRTAEDRIYRRGSRHYADFRDYAEVGGGQEALRPEGRGWATKDLEEARALARARHEELRRRVGEGWWDEQGRDLSRMADYIDFFVEDLAEQTDTSEDALKATYNYLQEALDHFGRSARLSDLNRTKIRDYLKWLRTLKVRERELRQRMEAMKEAGTLTQAKRRRMAETLAARKPLAPHSRRHRAKTLKRMLQHAVNEGVLERSPFTDNFRLPPPKVENPTRWMEPDLAALLIHAAGLYRPVREEIGILYAETLVGLLLLTGGRRAEICSLRIADVDFDKKRIAIVPLEERGLKNEKAERYIPLFPQAIELLESYLSGPHAPRGPWLFPSPRNPDQPLGDASGMLKTLAKVLRIDPALVECYAFRHTYCTTRLQTLDRGAPVAMFTVMSEMGHASLDMINGVYGHVGEIRQRREWVEYRIEQYRDRFAAELARLPAAFAEEAKGNFRGCTKSRLAEGVERAVLEVTARHPERGKHWIADAVTEAGVQVSPTGVQGVWKRRGLKTREDRVEALRAGRLSFPPPESARRAA